MTSHMSFKLLLKSIAIYVLLCMCNAEIRNKRAFEKKNAWNTVFRSDEHYDPNVAPTPPNGGVLNVQFTMYILDISKVNDDDMDFTAQFYFRQKWIDSRLEYDDKNVSMKILNPKDLDRIWRPDIFFVEEKEGKMHTTVVPNTFIRVHPNGKVFNSLRLSTTFRCLMDFRNFPHDSQTCTFSIESYGFTKRDMLLTWDESDKDSKPVSMTNTPHLIDFKIADLKYGESSVSMASGDYSRLKVELKFQRRLGFYLTKLYVPYMLLVIISWLSFWIKPKFVALRLALLLSVLQVMFYLAYDVNTYIPSAPYTKAVDVWMAFCISFVFATFLEFLFITQYAKLERKKDKLKIDQEALTKVDAESQQKDETAPEKFLQFSKLVFPRMNKDESRPIAVDMFFRYLFPILFALFNLIYWCVYAS